MSPLQHSSMVPSTSCPGGSLPTDMILEIAARAEVVTIVRCAAASKQLRLAILGDSFLLCRRLAQRFANGFDPSLLLGVSYLLDGRSERLVQGVPPIFPRFIRFDASIEFTAVASRDGLVVLRHQHRSFSELARGAPEQLCVRNTIIGHTSILPSIHIGNCWHALVTVNTDYFELLVMDEIGEPAYTLGPPLDENLRFRIYSSRDGQWSAVREAGIPPHRRPHMGFNNCHPIVIGCTVHWVCDRQGHYDEPFIIAVHVDTAQTAAIELPRDCTSRMTASTVLPRLMLATAADGALGLVVVEAQYISMWTLPASTGGESVRWRRRVLKNIHKQGWDVYNSFVLIEGFGERSGTVLLNVGGFGLVGLNLATGEIHVVQRSKNRAYPPVHEGRLHEINLVSLLQAMKRFELPS